ncbi:hypothetical protein HDF12_001047 [Edaphobacter lichenicola]|uniref:Uncharacterized protein n=1 Tax=Tunturiibacter lichenicola TaxID=2051959 RepID=A0A7Y9T226_9BACT|nr:hypothetical protein [Edaphobacter lichenicola]
MVRIDHDLSNRRFILKRPRVPPFCIHVSKGNVTRNFSLERCPFTGSGNMSGQTSVADHTQTSRWQRFCAGTNSALKPSQKPSTATRINEHCTGSASEVGLAFQNLGVFSRS